MRRVLIAVVAVGGLVAALAGLARRAERDGHAEADRRLDRRRHRLHHESSP